MSPVVVIEKSGADPPQQCGVSERSQQLVMAVAWLVNAGHNGVNDAELAAAPEPLVGDTCPWTLGCPAVAQAQLGNTDVARGYMEDFQEQLASRVGDLRD